MNASLLKIVPLLLLALAIGGCSSTGEKVAGGAGAPVVEAGEGAAGSAGAGEGAQVAGASEGAAWNGSELQNPDSPLYTKVIYFDYDSSEIRPEYLDVVVAHGEYLAANPSVTVTVEGHTDERGSREYNIALGERRANAVKDLLLAQGARESQIITISFGEERPVNTASNEAAWAQNRRVELLY
ncbi:MAG TPA: peptidoglycan-associated lipoprotein Pal [Sedimenticola sp.]|nr:peptidoglycan-associated lipoprotein Pal [Sedimenticola sp.]